MLCGDLEGWSGGRGGREAHEGGDLGIHIADSLCCTAELIQYFKYIKTQTYTHTQKTSTKQLAYLMAFYFGCAFSHLHVYYLTWSQELQTNIFIFFASLHFISSHLRACEAHGTEALLSTIEQ